MLGADRGLERETEGLGDAWAVLIVLVKETAVLGPARATIPMETKREDPLGKAIQGALLCRAGQAGIQGEN